MRRRGRPGNQYRGRGESDGSVVALSEVPPLLDLGALTVGAGADDEDAIHFDRAAPTLLKAPIIERYPFRRRP